MEPHHLVRIIHDTVVSKCSRIAFMSVDALDIIRLENAKYVPVTKLYKMLDCRVFTGLIVKHHPGLIFEKLIIAVDENIGYPVPVQSPVIFEIAGKQSAPGRLYDKSPDIVSQQIIKTCRFLFDAVAGVFQDYAVSVFRKDFVYALDEPRKYVFRNIGRDNPYVPGISSAGGPVPAK